MLVTINQLNTNLSAVDALLMQPHTVSFVYGDTFVDENGTELPNDIDITIACNGIIVNDDRISIEFSDGDISDYEIHSDDYHYIKII